MKLQNTFTRTLFKFLLIKLKQISCIVYCLKSYEGSKNFKQGYDNKRY